MTLYKNTIIPDIPNMTIHPRLLLGIFNAFYFIFALAGFLISSILHFFPSVLQKQKIAQVGLLWITNKVCRYWLIEQYCFKKIEFRVLRVFSLIRRDFCGTRESFLMTYIERHYNVSFSIQT